MRILSKHVVVHTVVILVTFSAIQHGSTWAADTSISNQSKPVKSKADRLLHHGQLIYSKSCADCHGANGEGVEGAYDKPPIGDDSIGELSKRIAETMPEDDADLCVGEDADAVAAYVHHAFYSEAARIRTVRRE